MTATEIIVLENLRRRSWASGFILITFLLKRPREATSGDSGFDIRIKPETANCKISLAAPQTNAVSFHNNFSVKLRAPTSLPVLEKTIRDFCRWSHKCHCDANWISQNFKLFLGRLPSKPLAKEGFVQFFPQQTRGPEIVFGSSEEKKCKIRISFHCSLSSLPSSHCLATCKNLREKSMRPDEMLVNFFSRQKHPHPYRWRQLAQSRNPTQQG